MPALIQQPVPIAIEADQFSDLLFKADVLTGKYGTKLDYGGDVGARRVKQDSSARRVVSRKARR